jgi:hypothetical protein
MAGEYHIVHYEGKSLLFIKCPFCGHLIYIEGGKKKPGKVYCCWGCDKPFSAP